MSETAIAKAPMPRRRRPIALTAGMLRLATALVVLGICVMVFLVPAPMTR